MNVLVAIILAIVAIWLIQKWMAGITDHGEVVLVPDLTTYSLEEAGEVLEPLELSYAVLDSSEFSTEVPPGSVVGQYPLPGSEVKRNRTIQLTLNSMQPRMVEVPNVIDIPNIDANYRLESRGFKVGKIRYVPDLGKDNVLYLEINGRELKPGERLRKGTVVDMVLGMGLSNERVRVPNLYGMSLDSARLVLQSKMLNIGAVLYDEEVSDTSAARIYQQSPRPNPNPVIRMGDGVDVWLTDEYTKLPADSLRNDDSY